VATDPADPDATDTATDAADEPVTDEHPADEFPADESVAGTERDGGGMYESVAAHRTPSDLDADEDAPAENGPADEVDTEDPAVGVASVPDSDESSDEPDVASPATASAIGGAPDDTDLVSTPTSTEPADPTDATPDSLEPTDSPPTDAEPAEPTPAEAEYGEPTPAESGYAEPTRVDAEPGMAIAGLTEPDVEPEAESETEDAPAGSAGPEELSPGEVPAAATMVFWEIETTDGFRDRWQQIQLRFIDSPRQAAEEAQTLVTDVIQSLNEGLHRQRGEVDRWQAAQLDDTEELRVTVRRYRDLLDRLLDL
jgi:hypothetical protein